MDFPRVDILSKATFSIKNAQASGAYDAYWGNDGELVFGNLGATLAFLETVKDYSWIEITFRALALPPAILGVGLNLAVRTLEGSTDDSYSITTNLENGFLSETIVRIPNVGTIEEIEVATSYTGATAVINKLVVVKKSDNFTRSNAALNGRASIVGGGFVYNAALGCYESSVIAGALVQPQISFVGLTSGLEYGIIRWEHTYTTDQSQVTRATFFWDGIPGTIFGPRGELYLSGDGSNLFPQVVTFQNTSGPQTAKVRLFLELGSFIDQNITAFGPNGQASGAAQPLYNPLALPSNINGWLFAVAGAIAGFATIPVTAIDWTAGTVGPANFNTLTAQVLNVTTSAAIKDLNLTRTANAAALGSLWYTDNTGVLTPTLATKYALRPDLNQLGIGNGVLDGIALALDFSSTTNTGLTERAGFKISGRPTTGVLESGLVGFKTDIAAANAAYTLPYVYHYSATQSAALGSATVTEVRGFSADSTIVKGSTVRGFYSNINSGTNIHQLYMGGTGQSYFAGPVGILNSDPLGGGILLRIQGTHPSASNTLGGVYLNWTSPATATITSTGYESDITTPNSAFTLGNLNHFTAATTTRGAASTITNARGFYAANGLASGTNNYGFYSDIATAAANWQLFMQGTASSHFNGSVGIGANTVVNTTESLRISLTSTINSANINHIVILGVAPATTTGAYAGVNTDLRTVASAFTLGTLVHYNAVTSTLGAGSTVTTLYGFKASNSITIGSTNYGFHSDITSGSGKYQLRMAGTAQSRFDGAIGVYTDPSITATGIQVNVGGVVSAGSVGYYCAGIFPSTVISTALGFQAQLQTANSAVTYAELTGYRADTFVKGAASVITSVFGFYANNSIVVGTNNYGFYSDINDTAPFGTKFSFYSAGTARVFFAGTLCAGSLALTSSTNGDRLTNYHGLINTAGQTTAYGNITALQVGSNVTAAANAHYGYVETTAAAFTLALARGFYAAAVVKGAGSTITTYYGFHVDAAVGGVATNTYGFRSDLNSASNTFQLHMAGTALNFLKGGVILDTTAAPTVAAGQIGLGATTGTTVGAAGAASALPATPTGYLIINVAGTTQRIPYYN